MKRLLFLSALALFLSTTSWAYDFFDVNDDGVIIYYNFVSTVDRTCEVTHENNSFNSYTGSVVIPTEATYNNKAYTVTCIGSGAFKYCSNLTEVVLPNTLTTIDTYSFHECTRLTEVIIPNSVTSIGQYAFYQCSNLASVKIGASVTSIGYGAFDSCTSLKSVTSLNTTPPSCSSKVFNNVPTSTGVLYVPIGYGEDYSNASTWKNFGSIVEIETVIAPSIQIYEASEITNSSALLKGVITAGDEEILEQGFEYWTTEEDVQTVTSPDLYMAIILDGLEPSTTYTYRAYAITESDTTYSEMLTFTTASYISPTVQAYEATEITTNSALLMGSVTAGDEEILEQGFEYWTTEEVVQTVTSSDLFMAITITGLDQGTTYTYRAYAKTESGTTYSEEKTFTTIKAPTVQTYAVTEVTENSALFRGVVTAGTEEVLEQGFEYWKEGGDILTIEMSEQMMAITIKGLESNTTYTCRAYAKTESSITYGESQIFTTLYDVEGVYEGLNTEIGEVGVNLEEAWTTITTEYPDMTDELLATHEAISAKIETVKRELKEAYDTGELNEEMAAEINDELATIVQEIEDMLNYASQYTAIADIHVNGNAVATSYYTTDGKQVSTLQRGINIIRYSDGSARKVLVK